MEKSASDSNARFDLIEYLKQLDMNSSDLDLVLTYSKDLILSHPLLGLTIFTENYQKVTRFFNTP